MATYVLFTVHAADDDDDNDNDDNTDDSLIFYSIDSGGRSLSKLEILGGDIYGKTAHPKSRLANFWFRPPFNTNRNHPKTGEIMGGFPNPPTMES